MSPKPYDSNGISFAQLLSQGEPLALFDFEIHYQPLIERAQTLVTQASDPSQVHRFLRFLFGDGAFRLHTYRGRGPFSAWIFVLAYQFFFDEMAENRILEQDEVRHRIIDFRQGSPRSAHLSLNILRAEVHHLSDLMRVYSRLLYLDGLDASHLHRLAYGYDSSVNAIEEDLLNTLKDRLLLRNVFESVTAIRNHLQRLDFQFELVGEHLSSQFLADSTPLIDCTPHQLAHLAGCDRCLGCLVAVSIELPQSQQQRLEAKRFQRHGSRVKSRWSMAKGFIIFGLVTLAVWFW